MMFAILYWVVLPLLKIIIFPVKLDYSKLAIKEYYRNGILLYFFLLTYNQIMNNFPSYVIQNIICYLCFDLFSAVCLDCAWCNSLFYFKKCVSIKIWWVLLRLTTTIKTKTQICCKPNQHENNVMVASKTTKHPFWIDC